MLRGLRGQLSHAERVLYFWSRARPEIDHLSGPLFMERPIRIVRKYSCGRGRGYWGRSSSLAIEALRARILQGGPSACPIAPVLKGNATGGSGASTQGARRCWG